MSVQELIGWIRGTEVTPSWLSIPPLLLDGMGTQPNQEMATVILRFLAGEPVVWEKAISFAESGDIQKALLYVAAIENAEVRLRLEKQILATWDDWVEQWNTRAYGVLSGLRDKPANVKTQIPDLMELESELETTFVDLSREPHKTSSSDEIPLEEFGKKLGAARQHHEMLETRWKKVLTDLAEFEAQRRQESESLWKGIQQELLRLAFDPSFPPQEQDALLAQRKQVQSFYAAQDIPKLTDYLNQLQNLKPGQKITLPHGDPQTPPVTPPPIRVVSPSRSLSFIAKTELETLKQSPGSPSDNESIPELWDWEWDTSALKKIQQKAARILGPSGPDLRAFLHASARIRLLQMKSDQALLLFLDAYAHCHADEQGFKTNPWMDGAVWGILVSFVAPYLNGGDRLVALDFENLQLLFRRTVGRRPLSQIEALDLMTPLGRVLASAGAPNAVSIYRWFLRPTLSERPRARQELAAGLAQMIYRYPEATVETLKEILRQDLSDWNDGDWEPISKAVSAIAPGDPTSSEYTKQIAPLIGALRDWTENWSDQSPVAEVVCDRLEVIDQHLNEVQQDLRVATTLLTRELEPASDGHGRLILRLTPIPENVVSGERLRSTVMLQFADTQLPSHVNLYRIPNFEPRPWMTYPGMDLVVPLRFFDSRVGETSVRVEHAVFTEQGTWRDITGTGKTSQLVVRPPRAATSEWPDNPYAIGKAIQVEGFFGRTDELDKVRKAIRGKHQDNCVIVYGDRRIGKTSFLNQLRNDLSIGGQYQIIYLDHQYFDWSEGTWGLYRSHYIPVIMENLRQFGVDVGEIPSELPPGSSPHTMFVKWMMEVDKFVSRGPWKLLVIVDELEKVLISPIGTREKRADDVLATLRSIFQQCRRIGFIFAGVSDVLKPRLAKKSDRLFGLGIELSLEPLDRDSVLELIRKPVAGNYQLTTLAQERIWITTGGHPYLVQAVCHSLYDHAQKKYLRHVAESDVLEVLNNIIQQRSTWFRHFLDALVDPVDLAIVETLSQLQLGDRYVGIDAWFRAIRGSIGLAEMDRLMARANELCDRIPTLIQHSPNNTRRYRIRIPLFAKYLRSRNQDIADIIVLRKNVGS